MEYKGVIQVSISPEKRTTEKQGQQAKSRPSIFMIVRKIAVRLFQPLRISSKPKREFFYPHEKMNVKTPEDYRTEVEKRFPYRGLW